MQSFDSKADLNCNLIFQLHKNINQVSIRPVDFAIITFIYIFSLPKE